MLPWGRSPFGLYTRRRGSAPGMPAREVVTDGPLGSSRRMECGSLGARLRWLELAPRTVYDGIQLPREHDTKPGRPAMSSRNIVEYFESVPLSRMRLSPHVTAAVGARVRTVVMSMAAQTIGCALVMDRMEIIGIFTERDVTSKVLDRPDLWDRPVDEFMMPTPAVIAHDASASDALKLMNQRSIRNLPVVSGEGDLLGCVSHYDLLRLAAQFLSEDTGGSFEDPVPEHNLMFVDLTGLQGRDPILVREEDSLAEAVDAMLAAGTGLVSVVNDRSVVIGELTEHDIFCKIACRVENLADERIAPWMTKRIAAVAPSTPISEALLVMAQIGHRYLVLVNETGRALKVLTFKELTEFLEALFKI